ncbi:HIT family protein [Calidifontibacter sp. DB0510]|uniref:HIT family protein n=2 Tax=Metallococcus carri TaxID=1656884 RepID=A0A967AYG8_9MICO|nr:HIT family protein [Metallococcus carri]
MNDVCLVCAEVTGAQPVPGGFLEQCNTVVVFHCPVVAPATDVYAGHLFVVPRRHAAGFADLTMSEAASVGQALARWSLALERAGAEHVYVVRVGHAFPHLHVMLLPRWPGTPESVSWSEVDRWPGARRGDTEFATEVVDELRRLAAV